MPYNYLINQHLLIITDINTITNKYRMMERKHLLIRLIISPFIFCIMLISYIIAFIKHFIGWSRYGGELVTYTKERDITLQDMYNKLTPKQ